MTQVPDHPASFSFSRRRQTGNALFLILIAVALFAALSYAVTQSGRGSGSASKEQASISAAQMIQQAGMLQSAIQRLMLVNNCSDTQISFENAVENDYNNASSPSDDSCHVFSPSGGGLSWVEPPGNIGLAGRPYQIRAGTLYVQPSSGHTGCTDPSSVCTVAATLFLPITSQSTCQEINRRLGGPAAMAQGRISPAGWEDDEYFIGSYYTDRSTFPAVGANHTGYRGKQGGCAISEAGAYPANQGAPYFFYFILMEKPMP